MAGQDLVYFDIAAVVVMLVSLISFLIRRRTRTPANRVYLAALVVMLLTAVVGLAAELRDLYMLASFGRPLQVDSAYPPVGRGAIQVLYYALRSLTGPTYLVLVATVSGTTHRMNYKSTRAFLWIPMLATLLLVLTNPIHHLVFCAHDGYIARARGIAVIYASGLYYAAIGVWWLLRWRRVLKSDEFVTLLIQYPIILTAVGVQYRYPSIHVESFVTAVSLMLVSAFVIRPEYQMDALVSAASLQAYRDTCDRAFVTNKPLCLVYLEIVEMERLRALVGKDELQSIVGGVSAELSQSLETGDTLFYLRNGLFCISSANPDAERAYAIACRMHEQGKRRYMQGVDTSPGIRIRSCVVRIPTDVSDPQSLATFVRRLGHLVPDSRVTSYHELSRRDGFDLDLALCDCLDQAIRNRTFEVYYQPIFCLDDNRFHSAEALARLRDPRFGFISPAVFIPEAEQSGRILDIGEILLDKACAFLSKTDFEATGLSYVEINMSTEQCVRPQMARNLLGTLREHGIEPSRINLEVTETSAAFSQSVIESNMHRLVEAGITFSLDDYGSGYSNVVRMLGLPFDIIKIDKSLVDGMGDPNTHIVLVETISMMRQLGKKVLVEGVETAEQAEELRALGVNYIQGYYYARPMPEDDFAAFLAQHGPLATA